jgi:hypothetical protein
MEGLGDPVADLLGREEATGGDFGLEMLDLGGTEVAGVATMVEGTEGFQALSAVGSEPLADLSFGNPEEVSDLVLGSTIVHPQDSGKTLSDSLIVGHTTALFDLLAAQSFQSPCHGSPRTTQQWINIRRQ